MQRMYDQGSTKELVCRALCFWPEITHRWFIWSFTKAQKFNWMSPEPHYCFPLCVLLFIMNWSHIFTSLPRDTPNDACKIWILGNMVLFKRMMYERIMDVAASLKVRSAESSGDEMVNTRIYPLLQMGIIGINEELLFMEKLLSSQASCFWYWYSHGSISQVNSNQLIISRFIKRSVWSVGYNNRF